MFSANCTVSLRTSNYLAFTGCAGRSNHCPHWAAKPWNAIAVQASFPDVIGDVISQAGVTDTAGTTLPFQDGWVLTAQIGASEWPAIYLSFLWRESQKCLISVLRHNSVAKLPEGKEGTVILISVLSDCFYFSTIMDTMRFLLEELLPGITSFSVFLMTVHTAGLEIVRAQVCVTGSL